MLQKCGVELSTGVAILCTGSAAYFCKCGNNLQGFLKQDNPAAVKEDQMEWI
jgi:hypothetical protein